MLTCSHCKEVKPFSDFHKRSSSKSGYQAYCKPCKNKKTLDFYHRKISNNPEAKLKKSIYDRKRREERGEQLRAYDKERARLPHRKAMKNESTRRRRATLKGATPEDYDKEGVMAMYLLAQKFTMLTGVEMHVDHILPLSKGGKHDVDNLQLLAGVLNVRKGSNENWELYNH